MEKKNFAMLFNSALLLNLSRLYICRYAAAPHKQQQQHNDSECDELLGPQSAGADEQQ